MFGFVSDGSYKKDLELYTNNIIREYGVSSKSSEREIICLSNEGNVVADKLYADMLFYKKINGKNNYREAFALYMRSADISCKGDELICGGKAYPMSFWYIAFYLVNYRKGSFLEKAEEIEVIEKMSYGTRLLTALKLSVSALEYESISGAINLIGRIFVLAGEQGIYKDVAAIYNKAVEECDNIRSLIASYGEDYGDIEKMLLYSEKDLSCLSEVFFVLAARRGYVFACNSLAAGKADEIVDTYNVLHGDDGTDDGRQRALSGENDDMNRLDELVADYIKYLKIAADKLEPYAANRLGLFYMTGEITGRAGTIRLKQYTDTPLAKEYFHKAIVYRDSNSAWAYYNLMKYFPKTFSTDIALTNEYMDYIKVLNKKVYDLAMDL